MYYIVNADEDQKKPNRRQISINLISGGYYWNSGMQMWVSVDKSIDR